MAEKSRHELYPKDRDAEKETEEEMLDLKEDSVESPDSQEKPEAKEYQPPEYEAQSYSAPKDFITSLINDTSWAEGLDDLWKH